ncbi:aldehyde reductase [Lindgomyces ingoldianus]|uniref:Aldehyde reductase n=1 Tax=Lindgomyces ingoldianus TaxID=673940 RepID=A0ACB6QFN9_9PLEO|nr:aldehyde reductase [Lindgomyces ingoldianus]KAF2465310.1 aldehyde reductase [Lindgomyces ingoldianus]
MSSKIQNPFLPPGSLILVTAANGLIASHIVDQLIYYGYNVRGTVRSHSRSSWMAPLFQARYPGSKFELVEIPDISASGCYDAALKGVSSVIHTAAINLLEDDPSVIPESVNAYINLLEAVAGANKSGENILRVILTSSSWAVVYPTPNVPMKVDTSTYNESAAKALLDPNTPKEARGLMTYVASKVASEQESWNWVKAHPDAGFILNSVMPATCIGRVLAPRDQAYPSTAGYVRSLFEGKNAEFFAWLEPQWYVDICDAARLHVAAAVVEGVEGERIFAWAETYTWIKVKEVLEDEMGKKVLIELKDKGEDLSECPMERSLELLRALGCKGWQPFEQAVRENIRSYYPK